MKSLLPNPNPDPNSDPNADPDPDPDPNVGAGEGVKIARAAAMFGELAPLMEATP